MPPNTDQQDQAINLAAVRDLLLAAFTPEELRRFCQDQPSFRPVAKRFGPDQGLDEMVDKLITYCDTYLLFPELLAEVQQLNPRQYARFEAQLRAGKIEKPRWEGPARRMPEILTVTRPISLQLVRVPAGEFLMGSVMARDKDAKDNELPPHQVYVPGYYIGQHPVTNLQYQVFVQATGHHMPDHWEEGRIPWGLENHPVVNVSWEEAMAFCTWLSRETGQPFRLPTEAEWEKAARGVDGRIYPWGDEPPDKNRCNFDRKVEGTTAIGRYSPQGDSPYGCADMAGNVEEWCQSLLRPYPYAADDGREDVNADGLRALRGGSFYYFQWSVRCAFRIGLDPYYWDGYSGFRVVMAPSPSEP